MRSHGARCALNGQQAPTTIEIVMAAALDNAGIAYVAQAPISNSYGLVWVCDFVIETSMIAIECDGDYWHRLPNVERKDRHKDAYLQAAGYTVLRFWEHEIKADVAACVAHIAEVMHSSPPA
jgi:very-short-patch-repair endonuclease